MVLTSPFRIPPSLFLLFITSALALEGQTFDCRLTIDKFQFDLTSLKGEHTLSRTRETPPSQMEDTVVFNLCEDLKAKDGAAEGDQCPPGTRCCLTKVNKKGGEPDRIVAVIPVVETASLDYSSSITTSPKGLSLAFHGASYPPGSESTPQSLDMTLLCTTEESGPQLKSYNGSQIQIEWSTPTACGTIENGDGKDGEKGDDSGGDGSKQGVGSGVGWFFLVLILAFAAYFGLGAYFNYTTYGASGMDLIPHRDFWKEVPYMLRDVVSHLCSSVRSRRTSSRGGYISV